MDAADALFKLLPARTTDSVLGGELVDYKDEIARRFTQRVTPTES